MAAKKTAPASTPTVSKHQRFKMERMPRSALSGAPWNPRTISDTAKRKLQENLKRVGLLAPITVNSETMQVVGGHQRLACLDALEGNPDYLLDVAMVKLTDKQAKEAALFLNNLEGQGEWDLAALASILPELNLDNTGFDQVALDIIFDGTEFSSMFGEKAQSPSAQSTFGELAAMSALRDNPADVAGSSEDDDGDDDGQPAAPEADDTEGVKRKASADAVAEMRKTSKGMTVAEDTERFAVVIFNSRADREAWNARVGLDKGTRYVPYALIEPWFKDKEPAG